MLDRLLESRSRRSRSAPGVVTSVTAHLAIIIGAIHATAQSRPRPTPVQTVVIVPYVPKSPPSRPATPQRTQTKTPGPPTRPIFPITIDTKLPPIDLTPPSTSLTDFTKGVESSRTDDGSSVGLTERGTFNADQVEQQVRLLAGVPIPTYPEPLRAAGIEGKVVAQFVVDERGVVEADSVRFVQSDNVLFEASVRSVLRRLRFAPAEIGGKKVRQLVQMPFVFTISRR